MSDEPIGPVAVVALRDPRPARKPALGPSPSRQGGRQACPESPSGRTKGQSVRALERATEEP
eukprot:5510734-Alexandrium_andersonii.AAC.1